MKGERHGGHEDIEAKHRGPDVEQPVERGRAGRHEGHAPGTQAGRSPHARGGGAAGEADVQAAIAELAEDDRAVAARIHELVRVNAPHLVPRTFYGMPAYARDGKVVCFFQAKAKFKVRYSTFGFQPEARLDEDELWPVAFALTKLIRRARSGSPS